MKRWRRALALGVVQVVPFLAIVVLLVGSAASAASTRSCTPAPDPANLDGVGTISRHIRVANSNPLVFRFGDERGTDEHDVRLALVDEVEVLDASIRPTDGESLAVRPPDLVDPTTQSEFPSEKVHVRAIFKSDERSVNFEVCVDLRQSDGFGAGSYHGSATLTDARFAEASVPVDVSFKSRGTGGPLFAALLGGVLGGLWGTISPFVAGLKRGDAPSRSLKLQALRLMVISAIVGLCAGLFIFQQNFVEIDSFRGSMRDLRGVGTAAFVAAAALYPVVAILESFVRLFFNVDDDEPRAGASSRVTEPPELVGGAR